MSKARKPHVAILLDESGSMGGLEDAVVTTFNEYVESVRDSAKSVSLFTFDSQGFRERIRKVAPAEVKPLTREDYQPGAMTPLYDSIAKLIGQFENSKRPVQIVTHTDGMENDSKEHNQQSITDLIEKMTKKGWLFVHLGEGLQGRAQAAAMPGLKMNFTSANRKAAMHSLSTSTVAYAATNDASPTAYTVDGSDSIDIDEDEPEAKSA